MPGTTALRIARNGLALFLGQILGKASSYIFLLYITRSFGTEMYGVYLSVGTLVSFLGELGDFGVSTLIVRDIAQDKTILPKYLGAAICLKMAFVTLALGSLVLMVRALHFAPEAEFLAVVAGVSLFPASLMGVMGAALTALELIHISSLWGIGTNIIITGSGILALALGYGLLGVFVSSTVWSFVLMAAMWALVRRLGMGIQLEVDWGLCRRILRMALPFALVSGLGVLYFRVDILLISRMQGPQAVAWYGAAVRPLEILFFIPSSFLLAMFPLMAYYHDHSLEQFWRSYETSLRFVMRLAFPLATVITILAERIVLFLYGSEFLPAAPAMAIGAWAMALAFINGPVGNVVLSSHSLSRCLPLMALHVCFKLALTLFLVGRNGHIGACVALLVGEIGAFFMNLYFLSMIVGKWPPFLRGAFRPAIAASGMGILVMLFSSINLGAVLAVGLIGYIGLLSLLGEFQWQSLRALRNVAMTWRT